jgi:hypothetical protein
VPRRKLRGIVVGLAVHIGAVTAVASDIGVVGFFACRRGRPCAPGTYGFPAILLPKDERVRSFAAYARSMRTKAPPFFSNL